MSFTDIIVNAANMNPTNLQGITAQCQWNEELIQKTVTVNSIAPSFDIIGQRIYLFEPSPLSATFASFPLSKLVIDSLKKRFVFCHEEEPPKEINWVWPSWEKQFINHEITIEEGFKKEIEKLSTFNNLCPNWDSFHAKTIDPNCISRASKILIDFTEWMPPYEVPPPFVVPRTDGSIQMEWERGSRYLEIGIVPDSLGIEFLAMDENLNGEEVEYEGVLKFDESIKELLHWFISGEADEIKQISNNV